MSTQEEQLDKYFETYLDLFLSEGWKQLKEELKTNMININRIEDIKTSKDLHFRKGQLNVLAYILNLEQSIEIVRTQEELEDA